MRWMRWGRATPKRQLKLKVSVVIEPDEGGFHAYCPALKGLHVDGRTKEEALENTAKAFFVYLESLAEHGEPLPIGPDLSIEPIPALPEKASLQSVTIECPTLQMSGSR